MGGRISKYGVSLRLVTPEDAEFIVKLRTAENATHISRTSSSVEDQQKWLIAYKEREIESKEFYFVVEDESGTPWGTTRIYNIEENSFETGSWIFLKGTPAGIAIKGDILGRDFAFKLLQVGMCKFEVRKANKSVIRYHLGFKPVQTGEDEDNFYFRLSKTDFYSYSSKLLKLIL